MEVHVVHQGEIIHRVVLGEQPLTIGRSRRNEIVLPYKDVSGHHAIISRQSDRVVIQDLQSSNGTFVNDTRIVQTVPLSVGDRIRLGSAATLSVAESAPMPLPALQLERVEGGLVWPIRGAMLAVPGTDGVALVVDEGGEVWLEEGGIEQRPVAVDETFSVGGVDYVLRSRDVLTAETIRGGTPGMQYHLVVSLDENEAVLSDPIQDLRCQYKTDHRVALLYALAERWQQDAPGPGRGWMDDDDLARAIWGRQRHKQTANNLNVLLFRIRKKATDAGLSTLFLQKRRSRLRLRVEAVQLG